MAPTSHRKTNLWVRKPTPSTPTELYNTTLDQFEIRQNQKRDQTLFHLFVVRLDNRESEEEEEEGQFPKQTLQTQREMEASEYEHDQRLRF